MITQRPLTTVPSTATARTAGSARPSFDVGLAVVVAITVALVALPLLTLAGVTLGAAGPVVVPVLSILGIYAIYQHLDT